VTVDGRVLTNYHVIAEGSSAIVKFPDRAFYVVDGVLASDKGRDVAVIKIHGRNFQTLPLGDSGRVQVGEEVVAIGNPLSFESTVSNGIVSGIRTIKEEGGVFLQTTAPISPGSSGGPLFNMAGEVIGITSMYRAGGENLNFAIPINDAKRLLLTESAQLRALPNESASVQAEPHAEASKTVSETLTWIQTHLETTPASSIGGTHATDDFALSFDSCQVTVIWRYRVLMDGENKEVVTASGPFDLGSFRSDPEHMVVTALDDSRYQLKMYSIDPFLTVWTDSWGGVQRVPDSHNFLLFFATKEMAERQQKAWHDAIILCARKPTHDHLY
jgi:hypothetical protein